MRVLCTHGCGASFDDEFRTTICPHQTFAANDGHNHFAHHPESLITYPDNKGLGGEELQQIDRDGWLG